MCGRFTLRAPASLIAEQFALFELPLLLPRFNIAPSQPVPAIRLRPGAPAPMREFVALRWGLIPSWARDASIGNRLVNARSETAAEKPAFRAALARRRCLVAADGFYEWQKLGRRTQPYFIHFVDDRVFAFAGLWEAWEGADRSAIETCTLLTTAPNELLQPIHERMPAILPPSDYAQWLNPALDAAGAALLLRPHPPRDLRAEPVGAYVNSPAHEGLGCLAPVADGPPLFADGDDHGDA